MYQDIAIGNIVGMELGNFKVVSGFRLRKFFAGNPFHFAKRSVGEKHFIAAI